MAEQESIRAPEKACRRCGVTKPLSAYPRRYYARTTERPARSDGHEGVCAVCKRACTSQKEAQTRWRARNREAINARNRGRPKAQRTREDRAAERSRSAQRKGRAYRTRLQVLQARAMQGLLKRLLKRAKPDQPRQPQSIEQIRAHDRDDWRNRYRNDPVFRRREIQRLKAAKLKRKGLMVPGVTKAETDALYAERAHCLYCEAMLNEGNISLDHMDPLSKGGLHAWHNLTPCCRTCNLRKKATPFLRWAASLPETRRDEALRVYEWKRSHRREAA